MTTCRDVITYGLRMAGVIGMGATPTASEANMGMATLQSLYDLWFTNGMFGSLSDETITEDEAAREGVRYFLDGATASFGDTVEDEESGEQRQPRDLALVETFDGTTRVVKLYDRTQWVDLTNLELTDDAPLAGRGAMGLAACLARTYCEAFGGTLGPATQMMARTFEGLIAGKHGTTQDKQPATYY